MLSYETRYFEPNYRAKALSRKEVMVSHHFNYTKKNKYEFLAFKKKPGWKFVKYPAHYKCEKSKATVAIHYSTKTSDIRGKDVVFFRTGPFEFNEWEELHHFRPPGQIWIFVTQEPASIVPCFLPPKIYRYKTYNWSFTFHSSSTINGAYGWYTPFSQKFLPDNKTINWIVQKSKNVAWISSRHCEGLGWDRTKFVLDLKQYIPIDMYGKCGNRSLSRNSATATRVIQQYKFHLSLENSCCSEYLSEKFWNALEKWKSVPIVVGGTKEEYERLAPPNSFIHADDFPSIEALAKHIKAVAASEKLFNEYFKWHKEGSVHQQSFHSRHPVFKEGACKVVQRIHQLCTSPSEDSFDPYGPKWFGSCYNCGKHAWIQNYNFMWRRTIFSHDWEDNRTLFFLDGRESR
ncbi:Glycoprotein 3-alpha-L-fucosyltransferase A [Holothuria leucospilota]|uniref:Fucosyltransferase n=1 Tax=Holothuria leucospilota TaxID=206669 RepID=A0A9Q1C0B2_HOLLE|nr:Glycoprotein 3-alpha-L-fucosyltransferase A [Holothuria leucospilota]